VSTRICLVIFGDKLLQVFKLLCKWLTNFLWDMICLIVLNISFKFRVFRYVLKSLRFYPTFKQFWSLKFFKCEWILIKRILWIKLTQFSHYLWPSYHTLFYHFTGTFLFQSSFKFFISRFKFIQISFSAFYVSLYNIKLVS